ncbi:MAG: glycosyltransferase family 2 protein [Candidatus Margulisiibacteriota bacterium]
MKNKNIMPELSIIIVSYNNKQLLGQCLDSIYKNAHRGQEPEIMVVDNNSQDGTVDFVREKFSRVRLIVNPKNEGFARANNQGIKIASGKKILLLNNDTIILNDALEKMMAYLDAHPETGLIGPKLLNQDRTVQAQGSILGPHFWNSTKPIETKFLRGAALMMTSGVLDKVGLLDEGFFFYNEDIDFCWRVIIAGYKVVYYPDAEIVHYGGKTSWRKQLMGLQGSFYLWRKYLFKKR